MIFPSKILAKLFDCLYLEGGNYRLVIFLIVPVLCKEISNRQCFVGPLPHFSKKKFWQNSTRTRAAISTSFVLSKILWH